MLFMLINFNVFPKGSYVYQDKNESIENRVEDLLSKMTLHEKVLQLQNRQVRNPEEFDDQFDGYAIGTVHEMDHNAFECREILDSLYRYMEATRLGIPPLACVEGIEGILQDSCTIFPHALAQGSTFNPDLIYKMTSACAEEAKAIGLYQVLSPVLDIARELRWGRVEETYGEDPFLISVMGESFINGYQDNGVGCMPKHFVAHGSPTGGLNCANVAGGDGELNNLYLYPFRKVIKRTDPIAIMSCYSAFDGVPVSGSKYYMTDILRDSLNFNGFVYSDWGSVDRLKTFHHIVKTSEEAARISLMAGIDLDIDDDYRSLVSQVEQGLIDIDYIDNAVRRILTAKFKLGLFDNVFTLGNSSEIHSSSHIKLAKEIADESIILLENNGILPLDLTKFKSIALIGPNSNYAPMGDYNWTRPSQPYGITLFDGLKSKIQDDVIIKQTDGCDWWSQDDTNIHEAVEIASECDVIILAIGTRSTFLGREPKNSTTGEAFDLSNLELPGKQIKLSEELTKLNKPIIVAFISGKPMILPEVKEKSAAVLVQWYGGEQQGNSLADIILGNVNPSGHLNVSFPRSTGNLPCYYNYYATDREYGNDRGGSIDHPAMHYVFEKPYSLWEFGRGLSYTKFEYTDPEISQNDEGFSISLNIRNQGDQDGKEVVQVYISYPESQVLLPVKQLKAFKKVFVPANSQRNIELYIPYEELNYYVPRKGWIESGHEIIIEIGRSSEDIVFNEKFEI